MKRTWRTYGIGIFLISGMLAALVWASETIEIATYVPAPNSQGVGKLVNRAYAESNTYQVIPQAIPFGDIVPQITQGKEILSVTLTPTDSNNRLRMQVTVPYNVKTEGEVIIVAMFRDSNPGAIAAVVQAPTRQDWDGVVTFAHEMTAGTTNPVQISVRVGPNGPPSVPGGEVYINGRNSGRLLGGASKATLIVDEIIP